MDTQERILICAMGALFVWHLIKTFGRQTWEALIAKAAVLVDFGMGVMLILVKIRLTFHPKPVGPVFYVLIAFITVFTLALFYLVLADRPTRWLLDNPRVKWPVYGATALLVVWMNR